MTEAEGGYVPTETPVRDKFSDDALKYADGVAALQQAAAADETLNGADAVRRLRGND